MFNHLVILVVVAVLSHHNNLLAEAYYRQSQLNPAYNYDDIYEENNNNNHHHESIGSAQQLQANVPTEKRYVNSGQSVELICDLPNSMPDGKVLFIKYDSKSVGNNNHNGADLLRSDVTTLFSDDDRYEIGQQYAWEWSLKIRSITEDDTGLYVCKVGSEAIKRFEIVVRVPPRIRDEPLPSHSSAASSSLLLNAVQNGQQQQMNVKRVREGETVEFNCFATGTPKPNITWYVINPVDQTLRMISTGSILRIQNATRQMPRRYQCRASNNIPPSDTRNFTYSIEFAPEIEIQSKLDRDTNTMVLNCTIHANPLTNRYFWRQDGNYITQDIKHELRNIRLGEFTTIAQLFIKYYDENDQGLYECAAENDLRVSKMVYNLKDAEKLDLIPIGYSNSSKPGEETKPVRPPHHGKNRRPTNGQTRKQLYGHHQRKHQRNHKNLTSKPSTTTVNPSPSSSVQENLNSPYVILINEDTLNEIDGGGGGAEQTDDEPPSSSAEHATDHDRKTHLVNPLEIYSSKAVSTIHITTSSPVILVSLIVYKLVLSIIR